MEIRVPVDPQTATRNIVAGARGFATGNQAAGRRVDPATPIAAPPRPHRCGNRGPQPARNTFPSGKWHPRRPTAQTPYKRNAGL